MIGQIRRRSGGAHGGGDIPNYICFTTLGSGTITLTIGANVTTDYVTDVSYSVDGGRTWVKTNNSNSSVVITTPTLTTGQKVYWKGNAVKMAVNSSNRGLNASVFSSTCDYDVSGNLLSLLWEETFDDGNTHSLSGKDYCFACMFYGARCKDCSSLIVSEDDVPVSGFYEFFYSSRISMPPELPATSLANSCYQEMFFNCQYLVSAPQLNAMTLRDMCYQSMFHSCPSLTGTFILPATTLVASCYFGMFINSRLPSIVIMGENSNVSNCLRQVLRDDTSCNYIKLMANPTLSNSTEFSRNVAASGVFVKHIDATWTTTGYDGVPTGWTVIYYDPSVDKYYTDQTKSQECDDHGNPL